MNTISHNGAEIPVTGNDAQKVITAQIFQNWLATVSSEVFTLKGIEVQSCDTTPSGKKILFIKLKVLCLMSDGNTRNWFVVLRGDAVVVLSVLTWQDKKYALLVEQPRLSTGKRVFELLAGMTDGEADYRAVAVRELEEESQLMSILKLAPEDVVPLFDTEPMTASPGLLDEGLYPYYIERDIPSQEVFDTLHGLKGGLEEEMEDIKVHLVPYDDVSKYSMDSKTLATLYLYEHRTKAS